MVTTFKLLILPNLFVIPLQNMCERESDGWRECSGPSRSHGRIWCPQATSATPSEKGGFTTARNGAVHGTATVLVGIREKLVHIFLDYIVLVCREKFVNGHMTVFF